MVRSHAAGPCGPRTPSLVPEARLVPLHSRNYIPLADEPTWEEFLDTVTGFSSEAPVTVQASVRGGRHPDARPRAIDGSTDPSNPVR
jgi:hypothetical protein